MEPQASISAESIAANRDQYKAAFEYYQGLAKKYHEETRALYAQIGWQSYIVLPEMLSLLYSGILDSWERSFDDFSGINDFVRELAPYEDLTPEEQSLLCTREVAHDISRSRQSFSEAFTASGPIVWATIKFKGGNPQEAQRCMNDLIALEENRDNFCRFGEPVPLVQPNRDFPGYLKNQSTSLPAGFFGQTRLDCQYFWPRANGWITIDEQLDEKAQFMEASLYAWDRVDRGEITPAEVTQETFGHIAREQNGDNP
ncbi:MAG: hypothetical protein AAF213_11385 [Pseudomonadota bacterium]